MEFLLLVAVGLFAANAVLKKPAGGGTGAGAGASSVNSAGAGGAGATADQHNPQSSGWLNSVLNFGGKAVTTIAGALGGDASSGSTSLGGDSGGYGDGTFDGTVSDGGPGGYEIDPLTGGSSGATSDITAADLDTSLSGSADIGSSL
jgi:hypothetical protein